MSRYTALRPTLAEADQDFVVEIQSYFNEQLGYRGPICAASRTAELIADCLTQREVGYPRTALRFAAPEKRGYWESVWERHHADALHVADRMRNGCWEDARSLLAHCLDFTAKAA
jgi:hypothetical protein